MSCVVCSDAEVSMAKQCVNCNAMTCRECLLQNIKKSNSIHFDVRCTKCRSSIQGLETEPDFKAALIESGFEKTSEWRERFAEHAQLEIDYEEMKAELLRKKNEMDEKLQKIKDMQRTLENPVPSDMDKETLAYIESITRSCPQCRTRVEKKDGCDHMWCMVCRNFFSWKSLQLIGQKSNPDYFAFAHQGDIIPSAYKNSTAALQNILNQWYKIEKDINIKKEAYKLSLNSMNREHVNFLVGSITKTLYMSKVLVLLRALDRLQDEIRRLETASDEMRDLGFPDKEFYMDLQTKALQITSKLNKNGNATLVDFNNATGDDGDDEDDDDDDYDIRSNLTPTTTSGEYEVDIDVW